MPLALTDAGQAAEPPAPVAQFIEAHCASYLDAAELGLREAVATRVTPMLSQQIGWRVAQVPLDED